MAKYRTWLSWVVGLLAVTVAVVALRSDGADTPTNAAGSGSNVSASYPVVGDDLHSLVVSPDDPETLYIGSHQGVSVSRDGGASWEAVESLNGADAMGWAFTDDALLVGGHPGLRISTDGEKTSEESSEGLPSPDVHALGAGGETIYAGLAGLGTFASTDEGRSWEARSEEFGGAFMGRIQVDPADEEHLLAPDLQVGAVESTDGGRTWETLGGVQQAVWVSWNPEDTEHIIAVTQGSATESVDGGATWEELEIPAGASVVEFSPHDPKTLYAAVLDAPEAKIHVSHDGGKSWTQP